MSSAQKPVLELWHGIVPLEPAQALSLFGIVAAGHGPRRFVEEGMAVPTGFCYSLLLLLRWLESVQQ